MSVKTTVDLSEFETRLVNFSRRFERELERAVLDLAEGAEAYAKRLVIVQISATPERGHERTGALMDSIYAVGRRLTALQYEVVIGASGSERRSYAKYNELGTYSGRMTFDEILADAEGDNAELIRLEYGHPSKGLEPRPWIIPSAVHTVREMPEYILRAVRQADG